MAKHCGVRLVSDRAYWRAVYYDGGGTRRFKSLGPKAKLGRKLARQACAALAAELGIGGKRRANQSAAPTLAEWTTHYLQIAAHEVSEVTMCSKSIALRYLSEYVGGATAHATAAASPRGRFGPDLSFFLRQSAPYSFLFLW
jgi:hypothetical protein